MVHEFAPNATLCAFRATSVAYFTMGGLSISPDGKTLATVIGGGGAETARIVLFDLETPSPPRIVDASHYVGGIQFAPDAKSIAYAVLGNGGGNVWLQPLDGSQGHPITDFNSERIWSFRLSPDGKRLGILRGHSDFDVVLLQEIMDSLHLKYLARLRGLDVLIYPILRCTVCVLVRISPVLQTDIL